ncbi:MAG: Hsp70 family protein, partial [Polyangiaceae bacterium]
MAADGVIVGIDLGTTNSCIAVVEGGKPVVIPNRGHLTTPSIVAIGPNGARLVGHAAKKQAISNPQDTAIAIKRLTGRSFDSDEVRASFAHATCAVVAGPNGDVRIRLRDRVYALAELSAMILQDLKTAAETHLQKPVTRAVITVPAYFTDGQRQSTRDAATIAGLQLVRAINEPTAAAIAFGFGRETKKTLVVYDLGGGTFDISIVRIAQDGTFEVLGTGGDTALGGADVDQRVIEWLAAGFQKEHGVDLRANRSALQRLKEAAEVAKVALSSAERADIDLPLIAAQPSGDALHLRCTLTRAELEAMCKPLVDRTIALTREALAMSRTRIDQVDDLLLVGGSSRIPAVHRAVTELLGRKPSQRVHPDEAVAVGAAIHGHALTVRGKSVRLLDVTPYTLGVRLSNNRSRAIIPKNTGIPTSRTQEFRNARDAQTYVDVAVLQGESDVADQNVRLASFRLANLRSGPAGTVAVTVTFAVDESGFVNVTANDVETGRAQSIRVIASSGLTQEEVSQMAATAQSPPTPPVP